MTDFDVMTPAPAPYIPNVPVDGTFGEEGVWGNETTVRGRRWLFSRVNFLQEMMKFLPPQRIISKISGEDLAGTLDEPGATHHMKLRFSMSDSNGNGINDQLEPGVPLEFWGEKTINKEKQTPGLDYYFGASDFQHFNYVGNAKSPKIYDEFNQVQYTDGSLGSIDEAIDAYEFDDMSYVYKRTGSGTAGAELGYVPDYSTLFKEKKAGLNVNRNYYEFVYENFKQNSNNPGPEQGIAWILGLIESKRRIAYAMTDLFGSHRPQAKSYDFGYGVTQNALSYGALDELTDADKMKKIASWSDNKPTDWRGQESGQLNQFLFTEYYELWDTAGQWIGALSAGRGWNGDFDPFKGGGWGDPQAPFTKYKAWIDSVFAQFDNSWVFNGSFAGTKNALASATSVEQVLNALGGLKIKTANITKIIDDLKQGNISVKDAVSGLSGYLNGFKSDDDYKKHVVTSLKAEFYGHLEENNVYYPKKVGESEGISMYPISSEGYNFQDRAWLGSPGADLQNWMLNVEGWDGGGSWTDLPVIEGGSDLLWYNVQVANVRGSARGLFVGLNYFNLSRNSTAHLWQNNEDLGTVNLYNNSYNFRAYSNLLNKAMAYLDYTIQISQINKFNRNGHERKTEDYKKEKEKVRDDKWETAVAEAKSAARARAKTGEAKAASEKAKQQKVAVEKTAAARSDNLKTLRQKNKK
ncbi:MAG: hypothetical protein WC632_02590 [Candidatus Margulisiibacteriota bacterium]